MVYEHLGNQWKDILDAARNTGFKSEEELLPFHRRLLQPNDPFR